MTMSLELDKEYRTLKKLVTEAVEGIEWTNGCKVSMAIKEAPKYVGQ